MNIEEIIKYTQKTPENTNPNMLRNMLGQLKDANLSKVTAGAEQILEGYTGVDSNGNLVEGTMRDFSTPCRLIYMYTEPGNCDTLHHLDFDIVEYDAHAMDFRIRSMQIGSCQSSSGEVKEGIWGGGPLIDTSYNITPYQTFILQSKNYETEEIRIIGGHGSITKLADGNYAMEVESGDIAIQVTLRSNADK